jgi:tetratricopeptide (TPR) repeat protein
MAAMLMLKDDSRSGFLTRWSTVGLLIVGLAMAVPLFAQVTEYESPQIFVPRDQMETLVEYQKMLEANPLSSLANYRIAELLFKHRHYQASANHYRDALHGDGLPRWTRVWSHIELGKIFDITAQRDRAMNEYQLALETEDNTLNALTEAEQLLQKPYEWPRTQ